jgi:hypothetical protein
MTSRNCANHEGRKAVGVCRSCGKYFCEECLTERGDYYYCKSNKCQSVIKNELARDIQEKIDTEVIEQKQRKKDIKSFLKALSVLFFIVWVLYFLYLIIDSMYAEYRMNIVLTAMLALVGCLKWFFIIGLLYWLLYTRKRR